MSLRFPLYVDLSGNNCTFFGGGQSAYERISMLLKFDAKITVISPKICDEIRTLDREGIIRYIPRKYYRGDCTSSFLCFACTDDDEVNISISDECKAKSIAVNVIHPAAFGTFDFPEISVCEDISVSVQSPNKEKMRVVGNNFKKILSMLLEKLKDNE